ncbi:uncharacterized protein LOC129594224 [Paramacrobiotus metropolitanus]|uniref:uncharacterized protein LOC129594224 n=1 Tax=Paramacrobiotus metropolitanus TaxID=2943436 RepID=UPI002445F83B|nr:uncharacterized protein LOC129594224 [Paramacrobiotus metropolitanus]
MADITQKSSRPDSRELVCFLTDKIWIRVNSVTYLVTIAFIVALFRVSIFGIAALGCSDANYYYFPPNYTVQDRHLVSKDVTVIIFLLFCLLPGGLYLCVILQAVVKSWHLLLSVKSFRQLRHALDMRSFTNSSACWQKISAELRDSLQSEKLMKCFCILALGIMMPVVSSYLLEYFCEQPYHFDAQRRMLLMFCMIEVPAELLRRFVGQEAEDLDYEIVTAWFQQRADWLVTKSSVTKYYVEIINDLKDFVKFYQVTRTHIIV